MYDHKHGRWGGPLALSLLLAACGGGGGGSVSSDGGAPNRLLSFSPTTLNATVYTGERPTFEIVATPGSDLTGDVYAQVQIDNPLFKPRIVLQDAGDLGPQYEGKYLVSLATNPFTQPGTYTGTLSVSLCRTVDCSQTFAGSPVRYPYSITVRNMAGNTKAQPAIAGLPDWSAFRQDNRRTGYVDATFDASAFSERWSAPLPDVNGYPARPVADAGHVFLALQVPNDAGARILALNAADGSTAWSYLRPTEQHSTFFADPVLEGGTLHTLLSGYEAGPLLGFNTSNGAIQIRTAAVTDFSNNEQSLSVVNGDYFATAYGMNTRRYDASGTRVASLMLPFYAEMPAFDGQYAYGASGRDLIAARQDDGTVAYSVQLQEASTSSYAGTPVLVDAGTALVVAAAAEDSTKTKVFKVDLAQKTVAWQQTGVFSTEPVAGDGRWFVLSESGQALYAEARSLATGGPLWSWPLPRLSINGVTDLALTRNLLFVSTGLETYALDVQTGQQVWSYPRGGYLAIAPNGILYISSQSSHSVTAINLR